MGDKIYRFFHVQGKAHYVGGMSPKGNAVACLLFAIIYGAALYTAYSLVDKFLVGLGYFS